MPKIALLLEFASQTRAGRHRRASSSAHQTGLRSHNRAVQSVTAIVCLLITLNVCSESRARRQADQRTAHHCRGWRFLMPNDRLCCLSSGSGRQAFRSQLRSRSCSANTSSPPTRRNLHRVSTTSKHSLTTQLTESWKCFEMQLTTYSNNCVTS